MMDAGKTLAAHFMVEFLGFAMVVFKYFCQLVNDICICFNVCFNKHQLKMEVKWGLSHAKVLDVLKSFKLLLYVVFVSMKKEITKKNKLEEKMT